VVTPSMPGVGVNGYPGRNGFVWPGFLFPRRLIGSKYYICPEDFFGILADIVCGKHSQHFSMQDGMRWETTMNELEDFFFYFWEPHDVACVFAKTIVEKVGKEKVMEIDRMNASGMLGKYCASFDYCRPVEILHDVLKNMEMPRDDFRFNSVVWKECREKGFLPLARECDNPDVPNQNG